MTLSAPGAGSAEDCGDGVFSTIPQQATLWSDGGCLRTLSTGSPSAGRYGYAEGTSFAAPIVAGGAALVRGANPRLSAAQTADVLRRTARQTFGSGWNSRTGAGVVDLTAAVAAARRYDVTPPVPAVVATPSSGGVAVSVTVRDTTSYASEHAAVASVRLEGSSDGVNFAAIGPNATGAMRVTDPADAGSGAGTAPRPATPTATAPRRPPVPSSPARRATAARCCRRRARRSRPCRPRGPRRAARASRSRSPPRGAARSSGRPDISGAGITLAPRRPPRLGPPPERRGAASPASPPAGAG